jgi:CubicO group peptidase (beta-lactamase class C family)
MYHKIHAALLLGALLALSPGLSTSATDARAAPAPQALAAATHDDAAQTIGQRREGVLFWSQAKRETDFPRMYQIFPADVVVRGTEPHPLPKGAPLTPDWNDPAMTLDGYMQRHHIAGVMVLQDGRVRLARYAKTFGPQQRWTSFSVAKSVTSVLAGIALQQGYIHSLDDTVDTYIPALKDSAYAEVTVRQLMTMTSGVRWNEDYADAHSDVAQMYRGTCVAGESAAVSYLKRLPRASPPGTHFNYNTAETDLLGDLVQHATRQSLAAWLSATIWKPYGMAADGYWIKDGCSDTNTGGSGLSATLADYARFGQFMLDGGNIHGKPAIASAWLNSGLDQQQSLDEPGRGYGYLWWTDADGSFAAIGIFGQMVYVDPSRRLVIAQAAAWPVAASKAQSAARSAFVAAVKRAAGAAATSPRAPSPGTE